MASDEPSGGQDGYIGFDDQTADNTASIRRNVVDPPGEVAAFLLVLAGAHVGQMVKINSELIIGRSPDVGYCVPDPCVSKQHVKLQLQENGEIAAIDLGSRNGTWVNGRPIAQTILSDGDKIYLGATTILKFSLADSLEESFQQHMYQAALRDALTGLYNRRHLVAQLEVEFTHALRNSVPLSVILIDIDNFKQVNDSFGHQTGDMVLNQLAERMRQVIRRDDFAARFGGEEFVVVCRSTYTRTAALIAERMRELVQAGNLIPNAPECTVTISAGVAGLPDTDIDNSLALMDAADKALYEAKQSGRNRVCLRATAPVRNKEVATAIQH